MVDFSATAAVARGSPGFSIRSLTVKPPTLQNGGKKATIRETKPLLSIITRVTVLSRKQLHVRDTGKNIILFGPPEKITTAGRVSRRPVHALCARRAG